MRGHEHASETAEAQGREGVDPTEGRLGGNGLLVWEQEPEGGGDAAEPSNGHIALE